MKKGGIGGGSTLTGLVFERSISFQEALLNINGYKIKDGQDVFFKGKKVAELYQKHGFYKKLLEPNGIDYKEIISKKLLPDNAVYVISSKKLFIIEMKYQEVNGSVDEKLQTCDFKKKQYIKLSRGLGLQIEYCYILNDFYMKPKYKDTINYIQAMGCYCFFGELPLDFLGLPFGDN